MLVWKVGRFFLRVFFIKWSEKIILIGILITSSLLSKGVCQIWEVKNLKKPPTDLWNEHHIEFNQFFLSAYTPKPAIFHPVPEQTMIQKKGVESKSISPFWRASYTAQNTILCNPEFLMYSLKIVFF